MNHIQFGLGLLSFFVIFGCVTSNRQLFFGFESPTTTNLKSRQPTSNNDEYVPRGEEECKSIQVGDFATGSARDQGDMGTCYAYAAADFISHCLNKGKYEYYDQYSGDLSVTRSVSALDISLLASQDRIEEYVGKDKLMDE